jgi:hypothetical protein
MTDKCHISGFLTVRGDSKLDQSHFGVRINSEGFQSTEKVTLMS